MGKQGIFYKVEYSNRKTVGIIIKDDLQIIVKAPFSMKKEEIDFLLEKKKAWIDKKINMLKNRVQLKDNEVMYLGQVFKIKVIEQKYLKRDFLCLNKDTFLINVKSKDRAKIVLEKYLRNECAEKIKEIVSFYSDRLGLTPKEIKIKEQKTKWGCCTYDNRIFFNWRLIMARENAIRYVVVHEMCHMIHKNHSKEFWKAVLAVMPEYKEEDAYLKEKGYLMKI